MHTKRKRRVERGYLVVTAIFLALVCTIVYACHFQKQITEINYEIETLNYELAKEGSYVQVPPVQADYSIYNWAITAESAAFSIVAANQLKKKARNNNMQYLEEWLNHWFKDEQMRPYATQIAQAWLTTNSTSI